MNENEAFFDIDANEFCVSLSQCPVPGIDGGHFEHLGD